MENNFDDKMHALGYNHLVCNIFSEWEDVKDELLPTDRKSGSGNGTIHVFLGRADSELRKEFGDYYNAVEEGEDPSVKAVEVKHFFSASNVFSMIGFVCKYYADKGEDFAAEVSSILNAMIEHEGEDTLETTSFFKLSTGSNRLRPYFKQFDSKGVFSKIIRCLLLPNSAYKISLYRSDDGQYAAYWLIGSEGLSDFEADANSKQFLEKNTPLKEQSEDTICQYLSAIRTKPFLLLAGISGTGKSRIVRKLAQATTTFELEGYANIEELNANRWDLHKPANFEIIQVKPNWHNSMDVVGYQTNIPTPRYVFTPFVEFIAKAWQHPTVPFFLCLDEMNLAPVEEYFAEFLSAIESRSKKGNTYETDPIIKPFKDFNYENEQGKKCSLAEDMVNLLLPGYNAGNMPQHIIELSKRFKEKGLTLPENLVVIGTVNMDETTFSFSRKVLDRAMSFEMNEVGYDSFLEDTADIITEPLTAEASKLLVDRPIKAQDVKDKVDADFIVSYLKAVNEKLDNTPFKLGYRAANEAILYVAASQNFCQKNIASVIDEFTTMKILSRIEGDTTKLRVDDNSDKTILDELETVINDFLKPDNKLAVHQEEQPAEENANGEDNAPVEDVVVATPVELKSLDKIKRMKEQLKRNSFVSYWD